MNTLTAERIARLRPALSDILNGTLMTTDGSTVFIPKTEMDNDVVQEVRHRLLSFGFVVEDNGNALHVRVGKEVRDA